MVESVPGKNLIPEIDTLTLEKLKRFISKGQYDEMIKLADGMDRNEFLKYVCLVVTALDQFKGLYGYLKQHKMVPGFLAHGEMVVVRKVVVQTNLLETDEFGRCTSIYDAIALSVKEDLYERVVGLFEVAQERPSWKDDFDLFVNGFFDSHPLEQNSMPLKRLLALHKEEFNTKHPAIFEIICEKLVWMLQWQFDNPTSRKLLIGLVGQPSLLTPITYAGGFLLCC